MKTFHCNHCNQLVFFENFRCERCKSMLGFVPELAAIVSFEDAGNGLWRSLHPEHGESLFKPCHNYRFCIAALAAEESSRKPSR